ncbi:MAG: hypothetical protein EOM44_12935 [Bacteroidia bacterium]|nr:hypothetical protein [Bacteroidia bacterium]
MKTNHRFLPTTIGSHVRIIGTRATGTVELLDVIKTSEGAELFAKIRYKNRLTRYSRVSDLGITLPKSFRFLYPVFDGKRTIKQVLKSQLARAENRVFRFFDHFIKSRLDIFLLMICITIAVTLILSFIIK